MIATIKDCLTLDVFKNAKVVAGNGGLQRKVKSITVLENSDAPETISNTVKKEELVLTTFSNIKADIQKQYKVIEELAKNQNSALVLLRVDKVDRELKSLADKTNFPIIVMPTDKKLTFSDVIDSVMEYLLSGDNFRNKLITRTIFHLLNFEKYSNFPDALHEAAINNEFQIIILSEDFNPLLTIETRHRTTISEAIRLGKQRDFKNSPVYTLIDVNGVLTYWGAVMIGGEQHYMFIVDNDDVYSESEITKLAEIIELSMAMWKYSPERDARAEFIKALRRGNKSLAYKLIDESKISDENIISVFFARGIEKESAFKEIADFEKRENLQIIKISEGDETYGMILSDKKGEEEIIAQQRVKCNNIFNKLKEDKSVRIFHVTGVDGIEGAADAYRLISETWSFVQNVFPYKRVFAKYDLSLVSNCINIQIQDGYVKKNFMELLDAFKEVGENKGKQLLETLEAFVLDAGMSSAKTSEFMGIHTNTVQYRLKRINDVLGVEVTGNRVLPGLTIALTLNRLGKIENK